jgi:hypothetical protein
VDNPAEGTPLAVGFFFVKLFDAPYAIKPKPRTKGTKGRFAKGELGSYVIENDRAAATAKRRTPARIYKSSLSIATLTIPDSS